MLALINHAAHVAASALTCYHDDRQPDRAGEMEMQLGGLRDLLHDAAGHFPVPKRSPWTEEPNPIEIPSGSDQRLDRHWYVCHPDGQDLGLIAPRVDTEAEAIAKRDLWNLDVPGHYVMAITEAPPEF